MTTNYEPKVTSGAEPRRQAQAERRTRRSFRPGPDAVESREVMSGSGFSSNPITEQVFQLSLAARQLSTQLASPTYAYANGSIGYDIKPGLTQRRIGSILRLEAG